MPATPSPQRESWLRDLPLIPMAPNKRPTPQARAEVVRLTLAGLATGREPEDIVRELAVLHPRNNTFPGEELLDLAADAIEESGASRSAPIEYEGIRERYLDEYEFRGRQDHRKSHYALEAAAMIRAGVNPDLLGEVSGWPGDDLWLFAFYALLAYVRVAAERTARPVELVALAIAERRAIVLPSER
jgi:hypothetical protein